MYLGKESLRVLCFAFVLLVLKLHFVPAIVFIPFHAKIRSSLTFTSKSKVNQYLFLDMFISDFSDNS